MRVLSVATLVVLSPLAWSAGTEPKKAAGEYAAQATVGGLSIGADYLVRTFGGGGRTFLLEDYLVIEVALYSTSREPRELRSGSFTLRLNGKKTALMPQAPGMAAASLKYPDWEMRPTVIGTAGAGDVDVILGRPRQSERFPGDPTSRTRLPRPPQAPPQQDRTGLEGPPPEKPEEIVVASALPEGLVTLPVSGYLYFAHKGKEKSIRSVELLYHGPEGEAALKLK